ncbi:MAG TPA: hypothetical protein VMU47_10255 [Caldimonas sp.]|nr:hypothetical protein [Caldimonas sp.]
MIDDQDLLRHHVQRRGDHLADPHQAVEAGLLLLGQVVVLANARQIGWQRGPTAAALALMCRNRRRPFLRRRRDRQRREEQRLSCQAFRARTEGHALQLGQLLPQRLENGGVLLALFDDDRDERVGIAR